MPRYIPSNNFTFQTNKVIFYLWSGQNKCAIQSTAAGFCPRRRPALLGCQKENSCRCHFMTKSSWWHFQCAEVGCVQVCAMRITARIHTRTRRTCIDCTYIYISLNCVDRHGNGRWATKQSINLRFNHAMHSPFTWFFSRFIAAINAKWQPNV